MFCESCGSFIPDNQAFCSNCGATAPKPVQPEAQSVPTAEAAPAAQQIYQQPAYQQPAYQQPAYQQPAYQQPAYQQPVQPLQAAQPVQPVYAQAVSVNPVANYNGAPVKKGNAPAVIGLVFGILTLVLFWIPFFNLVSTGIFGLLGLIFSIIGIAKKNAKLKALGVVGLILTILGTVLTVLFYALVVNTIRTDPELSREWNEIVEEFDALSDTGYSYEDSDVYYIDGDFATTDKGYISGVLHIDGFVVEF